MKKAIMYGVRHPWLVLTLVLAITAGMAYVTVTGAQIETNLDEYMPSDHPAFVFSDEAEDMFDINDGILIAVETADGVYTNETFRLVRDITERLSQEFEEISDGDIRSLYTAENIIGTEWGLEVRPFYDRLPLSESELEDVRSAVRGNEMINGRIVSDDETATLIVAEIPGEHFNDGLYDRLLIWVESFETEHELHIAGRPIVEGELAKLGPADMARMAPLVILVMAIVLFILLRSAVHVLVNLLVVSAATIWSFGLMTLFGVPVYSVSTMIPVMLIAIGTAFGIHLHNAGHLYKRSNPDADAYAVAEHAVAGMLRPVSMAAITTGIGFLALLTSQVLPVRFFGLFTAAGVIIEMVLALLLVPGAIVAFGMKAERPKTAAGNSPRKPAWTRRLSDLLGRRPGVTVAAAIVVVVFAALGVTRVWVDTSFLSNFENDSGIVRTDDFVNDHFPGTSSLNVILTADREDAFKEPAVLEAMDELQTALKQHPEVGDSFALTDYLKRMHRVMHEDREEYYEIPENRNLIGQYLLLYEMSGDPDNLNRVVDYGYERANLTVQLKSDSSAVMEEVIAIAEPSRKKFELLGVEMDYAGSGYKSYVFADLLLNGQMWSLVIAFGIIAALLGLVFRDPIVGVIGIVPIAITAVVNFGVMGLIDIPLSSATAIISSIAIGIGADYAIHFIEQFRGNLGHLGDRAISGGRSVSGNEATDLRPALIDVTEAALSHSGRAILFNAIAVMGGFAVLAFSLFPPNRQVGGLIALNMATSAVGTLTVLPVLLMWYYRRRPVSKKQQSS